MFLVFWKGKELDWLNSNGMPKTLSASMAIVAEHNPRTQENGVPEVGMGCFRPLLLVFND